LCARRRLAGSGESWWARALKVNVVGKGFRAPCVPPASRVVHNRSCTKSSSAGYHGDMADVTRTELNQQTARVLARVQAGENVTVTDRGRPIAQLTPAETGRRERRVASGAL